MKLILCGKCKDIFDLDIKLKKCSCGFSYGFYSGFPENKSKVTVSKDAIVLVIHNGSFREALAKHIKAVTNDKYRWWAIPFKSWVMVEKNCPSVHRYDGYEKLD